MRNAATGVTHSECNASDEEPERFLQIWTLPERTGLKPSYEQTTFSDDEKPARLRLIGSRDGRDRSVTIHQDGELYASRLGNGESVSHELAVNRKGWLYAPACS